MFNRFITIQYHLLKLFLYLKFSSASELQKSQSVRQCLEKLGPLFVKLGQLLSTRPDLITFVMAKELSILQDKVAPFSGILAQKRIEDALQKPIERVFIRFDIEPIASASISQVHTAMLHNKEVVVKVLRPNVHAIVQKDLKILSKIIWMLTLLWPGFKKLKPQELLLELKNIFTRELDLTREASSAQQLKRNFKYTKQLYIPKIYWDLTRKNVLVMERIQGISLSNTEQLIQAGYNLKSVAESMIDLLFCQVFRDGYFHADMHPGNIFIHPNFSDRSLTPHFIAVDFGIMGSLSAVDQLYLAENFKAIFNRDYRAIAELHKASGWLSATVRVDEFEMAMRYVLEPILEQSLEEISFAELLLKLIHTAMDYHIIVQPQLLLLQKTLLNVEGVARTLYPKLNIWEAGKTSLTKYRVHTFKMKPIIKTIKLAAPYWADKLQQLPLMVQNLLMPTDFKDYKLNTQTLREQTLSKKDFYMGILLGITLCLLTALLYSNLIV